MFFLKKYKNILKNYLFSNRADGRAPIQAGSEAVAFECDGDEVFVKLRRGLFFLGMLKYKSINSLLFVGSKTGWQMNLRSAIIEHLHNSNTRIFIVTCISKRYGDGAYMGWMDGTTLEKPRLYTQEWRTELKRRSN